MKKFFFLALVFVGALTMNSCTKEKRTERMLYKNDGNWEITTMTYTYVTTDENNVEITVSATLSNPGTFSFDKDGNGSYNFTLGGTNFSQSFKWSVSDESISIAKIAQTIDFFTGAIDQLVIAFGGEKTSKNQILMTGTETHQIASDTGALQSVLTITSMTLNKK